VRTNEQLNEELGEHTGHEEEVYKGCRMADESPNPTTSFNDKRTEYATATNPEHNDEAYTHAPMHAMHIAIERQVDDTISFENEDATL